jgi:hypothetical protein
MENIKMKKRKTFTCYRCHVTFIKGRSDVAALRELHELLPNARDNKLGVLCDDCWNLFLKWWHNGGKEICEREGLIDD